ncbi:MAG: 3-deoxy-manno-octulosonate cytidylyltransferase [Capsulimonadaceae bacterium]|nr:3-deoxy-manno-octulosonate cytidylyltransferase [Capsulimonadaceae bacterium]
MQILGVIPARLASTRLPDKVLRDIAGKPLVVRVYEAAKRCPQLTDVVIATDAQVVVDACRRFGADAMMTSPRHQSGSDRLFEVLEARPADVYVNIQGDEPLLRPEHVSALVDPFLAGGGEIQVTTLKVAISDEEAADPNVVKVITDTSGRAIYFSRLPIPYDRDGRGVQRFKHQGLYAYRRDALAKFHSLEATPLQLTECLEQLKLLENGMPIHVYETPFDTVGVDTEQDLERVRRIFEGMTA